jgi:PAS domain S-box-containing protein
VAGLDLQVLQDVLDSLPDYIWVCDGNLRETLYISLACEKLIGVPRKELLGDCANLLKWVHEADRLNVLQARRCAMNGDCDHTYRVVRADGTVRWIQDRAFTIPARNGGLSRVAGIAVDVTDRKLTEEHLSELAYVDTLTGLPNGALFHDRLVQSLAHARRNGWTVAVLFVDMDHFKRVNDSAGHFAGDALLKEMAKRLTRCIRSDDTAARLSAMSSPSF